jgi:hypothetical protein
MAKSQKRSNREKKKPKAAPQAKTVSASASHTGGAALKIGVPSPRQMKKK